MAFASCPHSLWGQNFCLVRETERGKDRESNLGMGE